MYRDFRLFLIIVGILAHILGDRITAPAFVFRLPRFPPVTGSLHEHKLQCIQLRTSSGLSPDFLIAASADLSGSHNGRHDAIYSVEKCFKQKMLTPTVWAQEYLNDIRPVKADVHQQLSVSDLSSRGGITVTHSWGISPRSTFGYYRKAVCYFVRLLGSPFMQELHLISK